jgi:hypothetical protein
MGIRTTDPELLLMNRLERLLRQSSPRVRENVINWLSAKDWSDALAKPDDRDLFAQHNAASAQNHLAGLQSQQGSNAQGSGLAGRNGAK